MIEQPYVVAGVDGSAASKVAAQWAATEAQRRGAGLLLVQAYSLPAHLAVPGVLLHPSIGDDLRVWAESTVAAIEQTIRDRLPDLRIGSLVTRAVPADVLLRLGAGAVLTVVGSHGRGAFLDTVLGSVAMSLCRSASGPVAVVRGRAVPATDSVGQVLVCLDAPIDPQGLLRSPFTKRRCVTLT
jgi:nucleotide-binding universal stress UspA family protein